MVSQRTQPPDEPRQHPAKEDSEIAAVAVTNQLILVTRNTRDFESFDDLIMDNWFQ